jgi:hypothetical protein
MDRTNDKYLVAHTTGYPDCDTFEVYNDYQRALTAFKADVGSSVIDAIIDTNAGENSWDNMGVMWTDPEFTTFGEYHVDQRCLPSQKEFIEDCCGYIAIIFNDNERIELRLVKETF